MLNMGFSDSIDAILAQVPPTRNMLLFSATMPQGIASITKKYMKEPKEIVIGRKNEGNKNIRAISLLVPMRVLLIVLLLRSVLPRLARASSSTCTKFICCQRHRAAGMARGSLWRASARCSLPAQRHLS